MDPFQQFASEVLGPDQKVTAFRVAPGLGKSREAQENLRKRIGKMALANPRLPRQRVIVFVPTHKLAKQFFAALDNGEVAPELTAQIETIKARPRSKKRDAEIKRLERQIADLRHPVQVWQGVDQPGMCDNREDLKTWTDAGLTQSDFCKKCPFNGACMYTRQKPEALVIVFAGSPSQPLPPTFRRGPIDARDISGEVIRDEDDNPVTVKHSAGDLLVVDEISVTSFLEKYEFSPSSLTVLKHRPPYPTVDDLENRASDNDHYDRAELNRDIDTVLARVSRIADSTTTIRSVKMSEIFEGNSLEATAEFYHSLRSRLFGRLIDATADAVWPKIKAEARATGLASALTEIRLWNTAVNSLIRFCEAVFEIAEKVAAWDITEENLHNLQIDQLRIRATKNGPVMDVMTRAKLNSAWREVETFILDASADEDLLKLWWPTVEIVSGKPVHRPPWVKATQVRDAVGSMFSIIPTKGGKAAETNLDKLANLIEVLAADGTLGLTLFKQTAADLKPRWKARKHKPDVEDIATLGGLRGLNSMEKVETHLHYGRLSPGFREIERMAAILSDMPVTRLSEMIVPRTGRGGNGSREPVKRGGFDRKEVAVRLRDGSVVNFLREFHPDPIAEWMRRLVVDEENLQAVHRSRAFIREEHEPLHLIVASSADCGLPPDEAITMKELLSWGNALEAAFARVGCVDPSNRDALSALTGLSKDEVKWILSDTAIGHRLREKWQRSTAGPLCAVAQQPKMAAGEDTHMNAVFPNKDRSGKSGIHVGVLQTAAPQRAFLVGTGLDRRTLIERLPNDDETDWVVVPLPVGIPASIDHPHVQSIVNGIAIAPGQPGRRRLLAVVTGKKPATVARYLERHDPDDDLACFEAAQRAGWTAVTLQLEPARTMTILVRDPAMVKAFAAMIETAPAPEQRNQRTDPVLDRTANDAAGQPSGEAGTPGRLETPDTRPEPPDKPCEMYPNGSGPTGGNGRTALMTWLDRKDRYPTPAEMVDTLTDLGVSYGKYERRLKAVEKGLRKNPRDTDHHGRVRAALSETVAMEYGIPFFEADRLVVAALRGEPFALPPRRREVRKQNARNEHMLPADLVAKSQSDGQTGRAPTGLPV
jgi:hypothetical protein